jgi:hypothetical protein
VVKVKIAFGSTALTTELAPEVFEEHCALHRVTLSEIPRVFV